MDTWFPVLLVGVVYILGAAMLTVAGLNLAQSDHRRDRQFGRAFIIVAVAGTLVVSGQVGRLLLGGVA